MKSLRLSFLYLIFLTLMSTSYQAQAFDDVDCFIRGDRIVLKYYGQNFRGRSTLFLKRTIHENCRQRIPLYALHLEGVKIVAKSKFSMARAKLRVGPFVSRPYRIGGFHRDRRNVIDFENLRAPSHSSFMRNAYARVFINNPSYHRSSRGPWQILLRGNVKVRKVVLFVTQEHRRGEIFDGFFIPEKDGEQGGDDEPIGEDRSD